MVDRSNNEIPEEIFRRDHGGEEFARAIARENAGSTREKIVTFLVIPLICVAMILFALWLVIMFFGAATVEAWMLAIVVGCTALVIAISSLAFRNRWGRRQ